MLPDTCAYYPVESIFAIYAFFWSSDPFEHMRFAAWPQAIQCSLLQNGKTWNIEVWPGAYGTHGCVLAQEQVTIRQKRRKWNFSGRTYHWRTPVKEKSSSGRSPEYLCSLWKTLTASVRRCEQYSLPGLVQLRSRRFLISPMNRQPQNNDRTI